MSCPALCVVETLELNPLYICLAMANPAVERSSAHHGEAHYSDTRVPVGFCIEFRSWRRLSHKHRSRLYNSMFLP